MRVGPINTQAREVLDLLTDAERCQVMLVTLPEETPVNELVDTAYHLEDRVGVSLGPVVVNGLYEHIPGLEADPSQAATDASTSLRAGEMESLRAAADFRRHRMDLQREQVERLGAQLPLPQLQLPYLFNADLGPPELEQLARELLPGDRQARRRASVNELLRLARDAEIIVTAGSGGVGKTTTAAVLALEGRAPDGGPSSSPSTPPSGWPMRSDSKASRTHRRRSRATGRASCGR